MKNNKLQLMLAGLLLFAAGVPAGARELPVADKKLEASAAELDKSAAMPEGQPRVAGLIKVRFDVDDARLQGLPGGITDENVQKIVALRQGPPVLGWGRIAKDLGLKLGPVQNNVRSVSADVHRQEKRERIKKEEGENGKKGDEISIPEKHLRAEKMELPDKPERPEKPETGGKH